MIFDVFINGIYKGTVGIVQSTTSMLPIMLIALILGLCIIFCAIGVPFVAAQDIMENNLIQQFFDGTISESDYYGALVVILIMGITLISIIPYVIVISLRKIEYAQTILMIQMILYVIVMQYTNYQDFLLTKQGFYEWLAFIVGIFALLLLGIIGGAIVGGITFIISSIISIPIMMLKNTYIIYKLKNNELWKTIEQFLLEQDYEQIKKIEIEKTKLSVFDKENNRINEIGYNDEIEGVKYEVLCRIIKKEIPKYFRSNNYGKILVNKHIEKMI